MCVLELILRKEYGVMLLVFPDIFSHSPFFSDLALCRTQKFFTRKPNEKKINQEVTSPIG